jgi:hypothetical protein
MNDELSEAELSIAANLRFTFQKYIPESMTDLELLELYDAFSMSEDFGNNDEKFPLWLGDEA